MKNPKEGFEQNISFEIKFNNIPDSRTNSSVGRKTIYNYYFNEEKGLQE